MHYRTFGLWLVYLLGNLLSVWKRASFGAKSEYTPWVSIKQYLVAHGPQLGINFLLSTCLFWTVWRDTTFISSLLHYCGIDKDVSVTLNPFTAAVYGVFSDWIMDFIVGKLATRFGGKADYPDPQANSQAAGKP